MGLDEARFAAGLARLDAGERLRATFCHDHGLELPLFASVSIRRAGRAYLIEEELEEAGTPGPLKSTSRRVTRVGLRAAADQERMVQLAFE